MYVCMLRPLLGSQCLSVRMKQCDSYRTNFRDIPYLNQWLNFVRKKYQILVKIEQKSRYFTPRFHICLDISPWLFYTKKTARVLSQGTAETERKTFVMIETVFFVSYELRLKKELSTELRTRATVIAEYHYLRNMNVNLLAYDISLMGDFKSVAMMNRNFAACVQYTRI